MAFKCNVCDASFTQRGNLNVHIASVHERWKLICANSRIVHACFKIHIIFFNLNSNCPNLLDLRNLQEQVKKVFCYQKLFWPFIFWIHFSSVWEFLLKFEAEGREFSNILRSLEQFFLTVGQNNFGNKISFLQNKAKLEHMISDSPP